MARDTTETTTSRADGSGSVDRRRVLMALAATGIGTATWQRALALNIVQAGEVSDEMIRNAEWVSGIELTDEERTEAAKTVTRVMQKLSRVRKLSVDYDTLPALRFDPEINAPAATARTHPATPRGKDPEPASVDNVDVAFASIRTLAAMLRAGRTTSEELTKGCLERLAGADSVLKCVVTLTEGTALAQARRADAELRAGKDRGLLHGIPWAAKDLIDWPGYPTTWGAPQFRDRMPAEAATVATRLEDAGAVLCAKVSLGALAMGDEWFGGQTRNPWNPEEGSSGSSAGSAAAVVAGLVPFAIGSETLGSIMSPSRRCGSTGLRPTFGRISRHGCMALSWSMDKIGPIARSVDDCGIVLAAVHGADGRDPTSVSRPFAWPVEPDLSTIRIGLPKDRRPEEFEDAVLALLQDRGAAVVEVALPHDFDEWALVTMLDVEAASVFDDLLRSGNTDGLNRWPAIFRECRFVPAVDYLRAARIRTRLMKSMDDVFADVDVIIGGHDLGITNLTGHPMITMPAAFDIKNQDEKSEQIQVPRNVTFSGRLYDESTLLGVASFWQQNSDFHQRHPAMHWKTEVAG